MDGERYICPGCAERFKNHLDLDAHLFNNQHCNPKKEMKAENNRDDKIHNILIRERQYGYRCGATLWAERCEKLASSLKLVYNLTGDPKIDMIIDEALTEYQNSLK